MHYGVVHFIHLLCGILFIGVVFFEVVMLEGIRKHIGSETMAGVEQGLLSRAKRIMPWVVGTLFLSGIGLAYTHREALLAPMESSFGMLLAIKIALALSVLVHFITAMRKAHKGCMTSTRFERTHLSVAIHMLGIVILAKAMFYVNW
jgi:hypothetical protein